MLMIFVSINCVFELTASPEMYTHVQKYESNSRSFFSEVNSSVVLCLKSSFHELVSLWKIHHGLRVTTPYRDLFSSLRQVC